MPPRRGSLAPEPDPLRADHPLRRCGALRFGSLREWTHPTTGCAIRDGVQTAGASTRRRTRSTMTSLSTEALAMGSKLELLEAEALQLTAGERAAFAQVLLASLDEDAEIEEAWAAETERRISDIESGAVQTIPIADALAQVRASLR